MEKTIIAIAVFIICLCIWIIIRYKSQKSEIAPSHVLQKKYGLYAENRPIIKLDSSNVPDNLKHLVPLAEKWGIGDDIIRNDFIGKSPDSEKTQLHDALYPVYEQITEWLDSFAEKPLSDEAAAFMYMQGSLDEMGIYILEEKRKSNKD